jgi:hypothetical protein
MSLNLLEQSYDNLRDLITKQHDISIKRELSIIRGKIGIYLKYQNINHEKYGSVLPPKEQACLYNPDTPLYVNTHTYSNLHEYSNKQTDQYINNNTYVNSHDNSNDNVYSDEEEEVIRREVKNEFKNIKNSPRLINVENNINNHYQNILLNPSSVYRDTRNFNYDSEKGNTYTNNMSNDNSKFDNTDFMA